MAYEEYDYYNEPSTGSLKDSLYQILNGLRDPQKLRETGEGISRVRQALPGVTESVARGAIAAVPGSVGDISELFRTYAPEIMNKRYGKERFFPTTREILDYVPRMTPTHEGATTLEDVGSVISPGVGGVVKDVALLTKNKPLGLSIMGPESALWNKEMAFNAGKMEAKGVAPEDILQKTGMVRGLDGQWRSELSDQFSKIKQKGDMFSEQYMAAKDIDPWSVYMSKAEQAKYGRSPPQLHEMTEKEFQAYKDFRSKTLDEYNVLETTPVKVKDVLEHPELLKAYPELGDIKVKVGSGHGGQRGSYNNAEKTITLAGYLSPEEARSTLLHELTHGIQAKEGFNRGGNPDMFTHQSLAMELKHSLEVRGVADVVKKGMPNATEDEVLTKLENIYKNRGYDKEYIKKALDRDYWTDEIAQKIVKDYGLDTGRFLPYSKEEMYKNLAGEAEARMVQNRLDLSLEELRQKFPYQFAPKNHGLDIDPDVANVISDRGQLINEPSYSVDPARKETLQQQFNKIAGGEKPVRSAVVMIGDKIFTGNTHTQAFDKAIQEGVVRKEGKKFIYPKGAEVDSDLFMLNDGRIVDRLTARNYNVYSSEGALRDNLMQIRPANSMPVDEYMRQAKEIKKAREAEKETNYRGTHTAPYRTEDGATAPAYELNRTYPDDVYGPNAHRYYGDSSQMDKDTFALLQAAKGNPDHPITIYRAVPKEFAGEDIYTGDWVTPNLDYAKQHGLYFDNGFHIIEKTVPAKHIWTNADSIHEFGYDPHD